MKLSGKRRPPYTTTVQPQLTGRVGGRADVVAEDDDDANAAAAVRGDSDGRWNCKYKMINTNRYRNLSTVIRIVQSRLHVASLHHFRTRAQKTC